MAVNKRTLLRNKTRGNRNRNNRRGKFGGNLRLISCRLRKQRGYVRISSCGGA